MTLHNFKMQVEGWFCKIVKVKLDIKVKEKYAQVYSIINQTAFVRDLLIINFNDIH